MEFIYYHCFDSRFVKDPIPDEVKLEMAKRRAAEELAMKLVEEARAEITRTGDVKITIEV